MSQLTIDQFSTDRLALTAKFYGERLRTALLLYPLISLAIGGLNLLLHLSEVGTLLSGLLNLILSVMFYFFPLLFYRSSSPVVETMLPCTARERLTVFAVACLIINPILTFVPYYALSLLIGPLLPANEIEQALTSASMEIMKDTYYLSSLQALPPLATCMYIVFSSPRKRTGMAIGMSILTVMVIAIIAGVYGVVMALRGSFDQIAAHEGMSNSYEAGYAYGTALAHNFMTPLIITIGLLSLIYTLIMVWFTYRKLRNMQV